MVPAPPFSFQEHDLPDTPSPSDTAPALVSPFGPVVPQHPPVPGTAVATTEGERWTLSYVAVDPYPPLDPWGVRGDEALPVDETARADAWIDPSTTPPTVRGRPFPEATLAWTGGGDHTDPDEAARAYVAWYEGALAGVVTERWVDGTLVDVTADWCHRAVPDVPVPSGDPVASLEPAPPPAP